MLSTSVIGTKYWALYIVNNCLDQRFDAVAISNLVHTVVHFPRLVRTKRVIVLGQGFPDTIARKLWFLLVLILWAISRKRHIYFYWIGSEVYRKLQNTYFTRLYLKLAESPRVHHLCGANWFVQPLSSMRIDATCLLFPYDTLDAEVRAADWPAVKQLNVLTYLTPSHWENNNGQWIVDAAQKYPDTIWTVIGTSPDQAPETLRSLDNVKLTGWVDNPAENMAQAHLFVRLTQRDAYAGTVRDAQKMRRIVIYTKSVQDVILVDPTQQSTFDFEFSNVVDAFAAADFEKIEQLRSTGDYVPNRETLAKALCDFLVDSNT